MKTFSIKVCDGPYEPNNKAVLSVAGDSAQVDPDGCLLIKAGDEIVFTAATGRWNYYQVQTYTIDTLKKAV